MTHRIRMARKWLMAARQRAAKAGCSFDQDKRRLPVWEKHTWHRWSRRLSDRNAIERRKDRLC